MSKAIGTTIFLIVLALGFLILSRVRVPSPRQQRLAICTTNVLDFSMSCEHWPPYQFLLGVPLSATGDFRFHGEITISQSTGIVSRFAVSSDAITRCSWLDQHPDVAGYILTWSRTNRGERLAECLLRGQIYQVRATFTEMPPAHSSLWLSSIKKVGLLSK